LRSGGEEYRIDATFHAQQAVEKCLKAVMSVHKIRFDRTHDLERLTEQLAVNGFPPPFNAQELGRLNPYAVTFRYDDEEIEQISFTETTKFVETVHQWAKDTVEGK